jgi:hypothetical protein
MTLYMDWTQRWTPEHCLGYPSAAARLLNAGQDMREALHLILSTTTDGAAREEAARALALADAAANISANASAQREVFGDQCGNNRA